MTKLLYGIAILIAGHLFAAPVQSSSMASAIEGAVMGAGEEAMQRMMEGEGELYAADEMYGPEEQAGPRGHNKKPKHENWQKGKREHGQQGRERGMRHHSGERQWKHHGRGYHHDPRWEGRHRKGFQGDPRWRHHNGERHRWMGDKKQRHGWRYHKRDYSGGYHRRHLRNGKGYQERSGGSQQQMRMHHRRGSSAGKGGKR